MADPAKSSVPGYRYDVFVSYAQANNSEGWVTRFKNKLIDFLNERLEDEAQVFWDEQTLRPNDELDSTITEAVRDSAVMVMVVSHKYLKRPWCSLERETFLQKGNPRRVMIVRYDDLPYEELNDVLPSCPGTEFFDEDGLPMETDSHEFKKRLHKLRQAILDELEELRAGASVGATVPPEPTPSPPGSSNGPVAAAGEPLVYIAPVSPVPAMVSWRDELTTFLHDSGLSTVKPDYHFFHEPDLESAVGADLDRCDGFVQLLDAAPFPAVPNLPDGVERWFLTQARQREHLAILRWRGADPSPQAGDFHDLALEADVRPFEFARFCALVRDEVRSRYQSRRAEAHNASTTAGPILVLRADPDDEPLSEEVERRLADQQVDLMDVPPSDSLDKVASQLPAGGLLQLYCRSHEVLRRIQELRAFSATEAARYWVLGFWNSPDDPHKAVRLRALKNVHIINDGDAAALSAFVGEMLEKGGQA